MKNALSISAALTACLTLIASPASAFCGFYVSGADQSLYNDATMVVMMRDGTKTVLSMQNNYRGPAEAFAMIVPVPVVLQEENVRTLPREIFSRVDTLAAPRLVEYWEQDPCAPPRPMMRRLRRSGASMSASAGGRPEGLGVTVEAEFAVGEYDIVILSANDSSGLDTWLRAEEYNIPDGAEPVLRPYVEQGTKFFVAKVDPERVTFEDGRAVLSPLRFHYDADEFSLPVRLGLLNSQGSQDLIVHILAKDQRYEVANYNNVTIPTNKRVDDSVREDFGAYYDALFAETVRQSPRTVVTEYSWQAMNCDPCPQTPLNMNELATLGADVVDGHMPRDRRPRFQPSSNYVLTRLHYRYDREGLSEDLVFRAADPIVGGRGLPNAEGELPADNGQASFNNFQGRYAILHPWEEAVSCDAPRRGQWGGPLNGGPTPGVQSPPSVFARGAAAPATPVAATPTPAPTTPPVNVPAAATVPPEPQASHCGGCATTTPTNRPLAVGALLVVAALIIRRRA